MATARTPSQPIVEILTNESILAALKGGPDESVIIAKIATTLARFDTRPEARMHGFESPTGFATCC